MSRSAIEDQLAFQIQAAQLPTPEREVVFARPRRWRFDFAWPSHMVAVEVEGGLWIRGAHTRGSGVARDVDKYNEAALMGWTVVRVTGDMVADGRGLAIVERLLSGRDRQ